MAPAVCPGAAADLAGNVWAFWTESARPRRGAWSARYEPENGWLEAQQLDSGTGYVSSLTWDVTGQGAVVAWEESPSDAPGEHLIRAALHGQGL